MRRHPRVDLRGHLIRKVSPNPRNSNVASFMSFGGLFAQATMENYDYEAAAGTIKIEDITNDRTNREILRRLKANDAEFDDLVVIVVSSRNWQRCNIEYLPTESHEFGWLGYYIGQNTKVKELHLRTNLCQGFNSNFIDSLFQQCYTQRMS